MRILDYWIWWQIIGGVISLLVAIMVLIDILKNQK